MHPLAGLDQLGSESNDLTELADRFTGCNRTSRDLVAERNVVQRMDLSGTADCVTFSKC